MDFHQVQGQLLTFFEHVFQQFQKLPGSSIFIRYVRSSHQDDPVRTVVELFLFLFAVRYLLARSYSTKPNYVALSEEVCPKKKRMKV